MRAVLVRQFGGVENMKVENVAIPSVGDKEVRTGNMRLKLSAFVISLNILIHWKDEANEDITCFRARY